MKLQCSCGAKYVFDATPEMLQNPVKFICPSCGLDASDFVNQLIRQEFGAAAAEAPSAPPPPPPARSSGLRISHEAAPAQAAPAQSAAAPSKFCTKHRERATEQCAVCHKPICPKCMEMFGYFCSPLCKAKADDQNLNVPVYAGRKDVVEAQFWRKTGAIIGAIVGAVVLFFGLWIWYAWFGSVPHPYLAVRFEDDNRAYYGSSQLVGKDQMVFLHGGTLARYDLKTKKPVWSVELITKQQIDALIKMQNDEEAKLNEGKGYHSHSSQDDIERSAKQELQSELAVHISGQDIWVGNGNKLTHYNWDSGRVEREITLPEDGGELVERDGELQMVGMESVTHISLATGDSRVEQIGPKGATPITVAQNTPGGGLPSSSRGDGTQPLDPKKVEAQAQNLNLQGRLALPATLSNARHEKQLEDALNQDAPKVMRSKGIAAPPDAVEMQLVSGKTGFAQFSARLLETREVSHSGMKAAPKKSVLDGNLNASDTGAAANEILNDMQRNAGGDVVTEDASRYLVTVHLPDSPTTPDWTNEVVGPPQLLVLKTVNVVTAGKTVIVLDKSNKKMWEATLTYTVPEALTSSLFSHDAERYGDGPCVERGDTLYVFDQAVLTSFDLSSGNARWRLPSVGIAGLFFDDKDNVYVNTTTGSPDDVKYSRQIDVNRQTENVVSKIDPKVGKILWTAKPGGFVSYLSGKFIYVIDSYDPNPTDEDQMSDMTLTVKPAYLRIARIRPSDGKIMWEYYDRDRAPVSWRFDNNSIELIFKREVQLLRYVTF